MSKLSLNDAVGMLISAAEARKDQWEGVGEGKRPDQLIDELWESASAGNLEAQKMAEQIEDAIDTVRIVRNVLNAQWSGINIELDNDAAFAEDVDREMLGDDFDILQDHNIGNK